MIPFAFSVNVIILAADNFLSRFKLLETDS